MTIADFAIVIMVYHPARPPVMIKFTNHSNPIQDVSECRRRRQKEGESGALSLHPQTRPRETKWGETREQFR